MAPYDVDTMSTEGCVNANVSDASVMPSTKSITASGLARSTAALVPTPCVSSSSSGMRMRVPGSKETARMLVPSTQYTSPGWTLAHWAASAAKSALKSPVRVSESVCAASIPNCSLIAGVTALGASVG